MNNLIKIREKIKKIERLHQSQLLATQNGHVTFYNPLVYQERIKAIQKELSEEDS